MSAKGPWTYAKERDGDLLGQQHEPERGGGGAQLYGDVECSPLFPSPPPPTLAEESILRLLMQTMADRRRGSPGRHGGKGGARGCETHEVKSRVALVRVPFYLINL